MRDSRMMRLLWTQAIKRSPVDLRGLAGVPAQRNSKGLALFALAMLSRRRAGQATTAEAKELLDLLLQEQLRSSAGIAWGYNFDWQGRAFFAARGTPTVVPTAFAVRALTEGFQTLGEAQYLETARRAVDFILHDLRRTHETADEVCFSYTPLDETRVFNASLLAGEALAAVGVLCGESELIRWALRAARYVVRHQRADGSWAYGADSYQSWSDNFHTAFILTSLRRIERSAKCAKALSEEDARAFRASLERGDAFWKQSFFLADGWPKYYHNRLFPADAHSAGAAVIALLENSATEARELAWKITNWSLNALRDRRGFFYYQRRRFFLVRTPFMRWTQAWMLYALARMLEESEQ